MHAIFQDPGGAEAETETAICKRRGNLSSNVFSKNKNALTQDNDMSLICLK